MWVAWLALVVACMAVVLAAIAIGTHLNENQHRYPLVEADDDRIVIWHKDESGQQESSPAGVIHPPEPPSAGDDAPSKKNPIVGLE